MTRVQVDRDAILWALNSSLEEVDWFLDLRTGDVLPYGDSGITGLESEVDPTADASRYQPIEPLSAQDAWAIRRDFAATVEDGRLRARLEEALDGRGAFRRFRHQLAADVAEEQRWYGFEEERLLAAAREQLAQDGVEAEFVRRP